MALPADTSIWTKTQYQSATAADIAGLTVAKVAALAHADWLSPAAYAGLSAAQAAALTTSWYYMNPAQLNAMSKTAIAGIPAAGVAAMSAVTLGGIDATHIAALTISQIGAIGYFQAPSLTAAQVAAMSSAQIGALGYVYRLATAAEAGLTAAQIGAVSLANWSAMSAAFVGAFSTKQVAAIAAAELAKLSASATAGFTAAQAVAMSTAQIAALSHADHLGAAAIGALTAAQVGAIATNWYYMGATWLDALSTAAIKGISATGIASLTAAAVAGLDVAHFAALTATQIAALTASQIKALTTAEIAALATAQIQALKAAQIQALSAAQIGALMGAEVAALSTTQIAALSGAQIAGLSAAGASGLTAAQVQALGVGVVHLSTAAMAGLSSTTLAQLSGWTLTEFSGAQAAALTSKQIAALTAAQVAYLTEGQLYAMGTHLQSLTTAALANLSITNLLSIYTSLSATQLAALNSVQAAAVSLAKGQTSVLVAGLSSSGLLAQADAVVAAGHSLFSYQGLVSILKGLQSVIGAAGLTATQFADLQKLAAAVAKVDGSSAYLTGVLNALVNGNVDNATWTGGGTASVALGNLKVGASATAFGELLGKWFLGTDLPIWSTTTPTTWTAQSAPIFTNLGVSANDPSQGGIGDCYLIAATVETALDQSNLIASMFTDNGNGTYGVRLFSPTGAPVYFTVDNETPGWVAHTASGADWVTMLEKAFVEWRQEFEGGTNAYSSINGGWSDGLQALTGKSCTTDISGYTSSQQVWDTTVKSQVMSALSVGEEVLYGSFIDDKDAGNGKTDLVSSHMFAVTGYDSATGDFVIRNPWGASGGSSWNGVFEQSIDQLWGGKTGNSSWSGFVIANGNSPTVAAASLYGANDAVSLLGGTKPGAAETTGVSASVASANLLLAAHALG